MNINIISIVFAAIYAISGILLIVNMAKPDMFTQVRTDRNNNDVKRVKLTYYTACFLDGEGSDRDHCSPLNESCNPLEEPPVIINHTKGVPLNEDSSNTEEYVPGDYNNQGGIFPMEFICRLHHVSGPIFIFGFVCALVCAVLQILVCLGLCSGTFNCLTQIVGFLSSLGLLVSLIIFGVFPSVWDAFKKDFVDDLTIPEGFEDHVNQAKLAADYSYERGPILYLSSFALCAIFFTTLLICLCSCCCKKKKESV
eukprot:GHVR01014101.1.p1 GENE.GHVR01014101.1~~GHVR01014101.1.p1  ORF type:complete len:254 (-),score=30.94 GHVR01014101.1:31-792(-)